MITVKIPSREQIESLSGWREKILNTINGVKGRVDNADYTFRYSVRYLPVLGSEWLCWHIDYQAKRISRDKLVAELKKIEARERETNRELRARFEEKFIGAIDPLKSMAPSLYGELEKMVRSASARFNEPSRGACGDEAAEYSSELCCTLLERLNKETADRKTVCLNSPVGDGWHAI